MFEQVKETVFMELEKLTGQFLLELNNKNTRNLISLFLDTVVRYSNSVCYEKTDPLQSGVPTFLFVS